MKILFGLIGISLISSASLALDCPKAVEFREQAIIQYEEMNRLDIVKKYLLERSERPRIKNTDESEDLKTLALSVGNEALTHAYEARRLDKEAVRELKICEGR